MIKVEFKDFTIRATGNFISLEHETDGYYGCSSDYDLSLEEVVILRDFLNKFIDKDDK